MPSLAILGFGHLGAGLYRTLTRTAEHGWSVAAVWSRNRTALAEVPDELIASNWLEVAACGADLTVEVAHPSVVRAAGADLLRVMDLLPLSLCALADDQLRTGLVESARTSGHRLLVPRGALVAAEDLAAGGTDWHAVDIEFVKHPQAIDFTDCAIDPSSITGRTVLYDGPVAGIAKLFPRNVNAMVAAALATIGPQRCRGILVADPAATTGVMEIRATGPAGARLQARKERTMVGVSGDEMLDSVLRSLRLVPQARGPMAQV